MRVLFYREYFFVKASLLNDNTNRIYNVFSPAHESPSYTLVLLGVSLDRLLLS